MQSVRWLQVCNALTNLISYMQQIAGRETFARLAEGWRGQTVNYIVKTGQSFDHCCAFGKIIAVLPVR